MRRLAVACGLGAISLLASACGRAPGAPLFRGAPIVLICIDTLRADRLPAYGYSKVETPHLERLRQDSILFENAYTHVPLTLPAHASLFTGRLPPEHGVRDNIGYRLDAARVPTLAVLLKAKGYATGGAISAYVLRRAAGIGAGFDFYDDALEGPPGGDVAGNVQRSGSATESLAAGWLRGVQRGPFFLFFHIYEPHSPFDPPEPFKSRYPDPYDGEVAAADAIVGSLLERLRSLDLYDRALVVLLSDHGEGLSDHGEDYHGILLYREVLHVPLMLKLPRSERGGTRVAAPVELVDVFPTLLASAGLPLPGGLPGRSLLDASGPPRRVYAETYYPRMHLGWNDLRAVLDERWHYIDGPRPELYDMLADPGEKHDLVASQGTVARSLRKALVEMPQGFAAPEEGSAEEREKLAALGYLGGGAGANLTGPLPNPRDNIHLLEDVKRGFRLVAAGRDEEGIAVLREVARKNPMFLDVLYELGRVLARLGRNQEAYAAYRDAMRASPVIAPSIAIPMARTCLELRRYDEAAANARLGLKSNAAQAHEILARAALARDDLDLVEQELGQIDGDALAEMNRYVLQAEVHIRRGLLEQALEELAAAEKRIASERGGPQRDLNFLRGDALARLARHAEAEQAFRGEIRDFPDNRQAYTHLAIVLGLQHRTYGEVDRLLESMLAANPSPETALLAAQTLENMGDKRGALAWRRRAAKAPQSHRSGA